MKRILSILLLVALLSALSACSNGNQSNDANKAEAAKTQENPKVDDLTLHSDVKFGMSQSEVESLEKKADTSTGSTVKETEYCKHKSFLYYTGDVAGMKGASIIYHFDNDDKLESALYLLEFSGVKGGTRTSFDNLNTLLSQKYGNSNPAALKAIDNDDLDICIRHFDVPGRSACPVTYTNTNAYTYEQGNGKVVVIYICSIYQYIITNRSSLGELLFINYQVFDSETYNSAVSKYTTENILNGL